MRYQLTTCELFCVIALSLVIDGVDVRAGTRIGQAVPRSIKTILACSCGGNGAIDAIFQVVPVGLGVAASEAVMGPVLPPSQPSARQPSILASDRKRGYLTDRECLAVPGPFRKFAMGAIDLLGWYAVSYSPPSTCATS
jgi:hypothetical protein